MITIRQLIRAVDRYQLLNQAWMISGPDLSPEFAAELNRLDNLKIATFDMTDIKKGLVKDCEHEISYESYDGRFLCARCESIILR